MWLATVTSVPHRRASAGWCARCGLNTLLVETLTLAGKGTANAAAKILALVGGMVAGADSINDMDLLRHGGMTRAFAAPLTE
jgi:hypothetical protein